MVSVVFSWWALVLVGLLMRELRVISMGGLIRA